MVAGQPIGFRINLSGGTITSAVVLGAPEVTRLASHREADAASDVTVLLRASSEESFAEQVQAFMMDRLDLHPLVNSHQGTSTNTHGWPAYYAAIYLQAGGNKVLLGDTAMDGLPGRLLQVFLDLPATAALTRVKTAMSVRVVEGTARDSAAQEAAGARAEERERIEEDLASARSRLTDLGPAGAGRPLVDLASDARRLAGQVADAQEVWNEVMVVHQRARRTRQQDAKVLNDVTESVTARLLFHGLDPQVCPRCDQDIAEDRRQQERTVHECAVCARPVQGADEDREEITAEAYDRLNASIAAEKEAAAALEAAEENLARLTAELEGAEELLRNARSATDLLERLAAQEAVVRLEGALSVLPAVTVRLPDPAEAEVIAVLKAGTAVLEEDSKKAAANLFDELNTEIADLGRRFGIDSLERVEIDRGGRLKVFKDGGAQDWFKNQTPGGRLRLRIAVVIALLRVGARRAVSTHPGLLLIDSPKAEEVQDLDARSLLHELAGLAADENLQILITTADSALAHDVLPGENIIEAPDGRPLW